MVASNPNSPVRAARVGSGGMSIAVNADTSQLRPEVTAALSTLRQDIAQASKDLKARPKVEWDFAESAFQRGLRQAVRQIEASPVKLRIATELDQRGLGEVARQLGIIKQQAAAEPTRARRFSGFDAEVRDEMAGQLRKIRRDTREYEVKRAARAYVGGEDEDGGPARPPEHPTGLARLFQMGKALQVGLTGATAAYAIASVPSVAQTVRGLGAAAVGDPIGRRQGMLSAMEGANSIPVIGYAARALDELTGTSRSLNAQLKSMLSIEDRAVRIAQVSGDPVQIAGATGTLAARRLGREVGGQYGKDVAWATALGHVPGVSGILVDNMRENFHTGVADIKDQLRENRLNMEIAGLARRATFRGMEAEGTTSLLRAALMPRAAARESFRVQLANDADTAPPFLRADALGSLRGRLGFLGAALPNLGGTIGMINDQRQLAYDVDESRSLRRAKFNEETRIGAAEATTHFRGLDATASTFTRLRDLQDEIANTPDEFGQQLRARTRGIAEARAMAVRLAPMSGGHAQRIMPGLGQAPDGSILPPTVLDRAEALRETSAFILRNTGARRGTEYDSLPDRASPAEMKDLAMAIRELTKTVRSLDDNAGGADLRLLNAPRGGTGGFRR